MPVPRLDVTREKRLLILTGRESLRHINLEIGYSIRLTFKARDGSP
jgi:hypothetical protein